METSKRGQTELQSSVYNLLTQIKEVSQLSSDLVRLEQTEFELLKIFAKWNEDKQNG